MTRKKSAPESRPPASVIAYGSKSLRQLRRIAKTSTNRARRHLRMMGENPTNDARFSDACVRVASVQAEVWNRNAEDPAWQKGKAIRLFESNAVRSMACDELSIEADSVRKNMEGRKKA